MNITRRQAISSIALASGAAMLPNACASGEHAEKKGSEERKFFYSLNTSTISGRSPGIKTYIDIAAEAGYDYIEVWVRDVQAYIDEGNSAFSLKSYIEDKGIKVVSAIGFAPWMTGGEAGFSQMEMEMYMLAAIGCPRIAAPPAGVDPTEPLDLFMAGEKYAELLELGRRTGVMPQLEFWGASEVLWHMGQVLFIAAVANDPDTRILPDVYHMFRGGSGYDTLKMLNGNLIDLFHMNDFPGNIPRLQQNDADRVYPGDGVAPMQQILTDLNRMEGEKVLSLELFNREYWEKDPGEVARTGLEKMKNLVKDIQEENTL